MDVNAEPLPSRSGVPPVPPGSSPEMERLARDFRAFIADCEALLRNAQTLSGEGASVLRTELTRKMSEARTRLDELKVATSEQAVRARGATEDYVRREPLKALCAAAAVGAVVGLLVSRR
jgi:ElaB/YqjD/DUF883 family membrane-anchored ribosome-binding protein